MCSGERPIGAAKGKQPKTEALCQPPPSKAGVLKQALGYQLQCQKAVVGAVGGHSEQYKYPNLLHSIGVKRPLELPFVEKQLGWMGFWLPPFRPLHPCSTCPQGP